MEIVKMPAGETADENTDCIKIGRIPDGRYSLVTSALVISDDEADAGDSEAVVGSDSYATYEEAEAAGLAWAAGLGVDTLYVETSA